mgnify:CR=1 FL=1
MTVWTEDRITRLRSLWCEGRTAESISRDLGAGISRSAVLGKVHRLGLSALRPESTAGENRPRPAATERTRPPAGARSEVRHGSAVSPSVGRRTVLTIRRRECRWPLGDPLQPGFSLCGCPVSRGAFCSDHAAIAYRGATQTFEQLARLAGV